jgi:hypothetical protein
VVAVAVHHATPTKVAVDNCDQEISDIWRKDRMRALSFASQLSLKRLAMVGEFWTKRGAPPQSADEAAINAQPHQPRETMGLED